jgi:hypothetical protein
MSIVSEALAANNAERLEKVLLLSLQDCEHIRKFAKEHLYPRYLLECGEAWIKPNTEICEAFSDKDIVIN